MPRNDGTGPNGTGPLTGRGLGRCAPKNSQTKTTVNERGLGQGRGLGRGQRGMGGPNSK